jgi:hypothetical protein
VSPYTELNDSDVTIDTLNKILDKFPADESGLATKSVFCGFDGYVDSLYSLVATRESPEDFTTMDSMTQFSDRVANTAGSSCNIERVLKKMIGGGFAPNIGRALVNLGMNLHLAASIGYPDVLPLFQEYPPEILKRVHYMSVNNPGETAGLEFMDGKVMLTDLGNINDLSWDLVIERIGRDQFIEVLESSDAIGQGHWSLVSHMSDMWERMVEDIFPNLSNPKGKRFYVDPADMTKRSAADVQRMASLMGRVNEYLKATLSLNDKEAGQIAAALPGLPEVTSQEDLHGIGRDIEAQVNIDSIVIHSPQFATITTPDAHFFVKEGFTRGPKFTTAAGDHFNGGVLLGLLQDYTPAESIIVGNAVTAYFVRTGESPSVAKTRSFLENYMQYIENDYDYVL